MCSFHLPIWSLIFNCQYLTFGTDLANTLFMPTSYSFVSLGLIYGAERSYDIYFYTLVEIYVI
jgi:hypothetical protein